MEFNLFLNELSLDCEIPLDMHTMRIAVLGAISAVRAAKKLRPELQLLSEIRFAKLSLKVDLNQHFSLAEVLPGNQYKEEWRFVSQLDKYNIQYQSSGSETMSLDENVVFQKKSAIGMLRASRDGSLILSVGLIGAWQKSWVDAHWEKLAPAGCIESHPIRLANVSSPSHVAEHSDLISNHGHPVSTSSIILRTDDFDIRMYFNDHDPPHVHVVNRGSGGCTARFAIRTLDVLSTSGELPSGQFRRIFNWAKKRRNDLLENWTRCRSGKHPLYLAEYE